MEIIFEDNANIVGGRFLGGGNLMSGTQGERDSICIKGGKGIHSKTFDLMLLNIGFVVYMTIVLSSTVYLRLLCCLAQGIHV